MAHYIDNKEFFAAISQYGVDIRRAKRNKQDAPPVTEYLGSCILQIAQHLAFKPNFINYSFRDEMISDAVENCLKYINNFDPKKSNNPFAYFTQISYYAFLRRIHKEKRVTETKQRYLANIDIHDLVMINGDETQYANAILANARNHIDQMPSVPLPETPEKYRRKPKYLSQGEDDDVLEEDGCLLNL